MVAARLVNSRPYYEGMDRNTSLERHLELCKRVYERMKREGTWPWPDSQKANDMIESENNDKKL